VTLRTGIWLEIQRVCGNNRDYDEHGESLFVFTLSYVFLEFDDSVLPKPNFSDVHRPRVGSRIKSVASNCTWPAPCASLSWSVRKPVWQGLGKQNARNINELISRRSVKFGVGHVSSKNNSRWNRNCETPCDFLPDDISRNECARSRGKYSSPLRTRSMINA